MDPHGNESGHAKLDAAAEALVPHVIAFEDDPTQLPISVRTAPGEDATVTAPYRRSGPWRLRHHGAGAFRRRTHHRGFPVLYPPAGRNDPIVLDVPPEVAHCPFCGGALRAEVGSAQTNGFRVGIAVTCAGNKDADYDRLEHLVWREDLGR